MTPSQFSSLSLLEKLRVSDDWEKLRVSDDCKLQSRPFVSLLGVTWVGMRLVLCHRRTPMTIPSPLVLSTLGRIPRPRDPDCYPRPSRPLDSVWEVRESIVRTDLLY